MDFPNIINRVFNTPLAIDPHKAVTVLRVLGPRLGLDDGQIVLIADDVRALGAERVRPEPVAAVPGAVESRKPYVVTDRGVAVIGEETVAVEFDTGGLTFTIADGSTDFAAGDAFTITVSGGADAGKYKEYDPANTDGSETAMAVLLDAVDATGADADGVASARDAEVASAALAWFSGATLSQKTTGEGELAAA